VVLAQMLDGDHMDDGWWWVMGIGWLVLLAAFVVLAVVLVRHLTRTSPTRHGAEDVLAERFARGEIDEDEYQSRRDTLRS
jgi:putative membrane protein